MKIGIIGFGNMGRAIAERIKSKYPISVFDKDENKTRELKEIESALDAKRLVRNTEVVILAVKPQDVDSLLAEIKDSLKGKLLISIAAGISTKHIENFLNDVRVIRVMPNIAARIGESVTCLSKGSSAADNDLFFARQLFDCLGVTKEIDEDLMNAATAISGSGPGYIFYFIERETVYSNNIPESVKYNIMQKLTDAAITVGFSAEDADFLARHTVNSSFKLLEVTKIPAWELRAQVSSKGGTTQAALEILNNGGSWNQAAQAALKRAEELAKEG